MSISAENVSKGFVFGMLSGAGSIVIKTGLNILLIPIILSMLGMNAFGLYILMIGIVEISMLLDLGLTDALIKFLGDASAKSSALSDAESIQKEKTVLKVGHLLFAALSLLFLMVGFALWPWMPDIFHIPQKLVPVAHLGMALILVEGALSLYSTYYRAVLLSHCQHQWANIGDTLYHVISNLAAVLLLLAGCDLVAVMAARLFAALLRTLLMLVQALRIDSGVLFPQAAYCSKTMKEMVHLGAHGMMINFSIVVSHKIDVFVIALFLPLGLVGIYELVFRFVGLSQQIALKLNEGVWPMFTRLLSLDQQDDARQLFLRMSCFLNFVVCLILVIIVSFYPELFSLFSAGKIPMKSTLPLLAIAVPCMWSGGLQMPAGAYLFMSGKQKFLTVSSIVTALANLTLSLILVQFLGLIGVALGTLIPQVIQHQASLIREACRGLNIGFNQYISAVHLNNIIPLMAALGWIWICKLALHHVTDMPLLLMAAIALSAGLLASLLWFLLTGSAMEKKLFMIKILYPLKHKLLPNNPGAAHGTY